MKKKNVMKLREVGGGLGRWWRLGEVGEAWGSWAVAGVPVRSSGWYHRATTT